MQWIVPFANFSPFSKASVYKACRRLVSQLAEQEGLTKGYVDRLLRLNLLAPDIVGAILEGDQPRDLKLQDLLRNDIPIIWKEQREKFRV